MVDLNLIGVNKNSCSLGNRSEDYFKATMDDFSLYLAFISVANKAINNLIKIIEMTEGTWVPKDNPKIGLIPCIFNFNCYDCTAANWNFFITNIYNDKVPFKNLMIQYASSIRRHSCHTAYTSYMAKLTMSLFHSTPSTYRTETETITYIEDAVCNPIFWMIPLIQDSLQAKFIQSLSI